MTSHVTSGHHWKGSDWFWNTLLLLTQRRLWMLVCDDQSPLPIWWDLEIHKENMPLACLWGGVQGMNWKGRPTSWLQMQCHQWPRIPTAISPPMIDSVPFASNLVSCQGLCFRDIRTWETVRLIRACCAVLSLDLQQENPGVAACDCNPSDGGAEAKAHPWSSLAS